MRNLLRVGLVALLAASTVSAQNVRTATQVDTGAVGTSEEPAVVSSGNVSVIAWNNDGDNAVYAVASDGRGISWSAPTQLDNDVTGANKETQFDWIAIDGNSIYVMWIDARNAAFEDDLHLNYSTDGGATWTGDVVVATPYGAGGADVQNARIAVDGSNVYVLLMAEPAGLTNEELYLATSTDGGATFGAAVHVPQGVAAGAFDVDSIDLAASGSNVYVVWHDNRNGSNDDVWFQASSDGGATWNAADTAMKTNGAAVSDADFDLHIVVEGSDIAVAWTEERASTTNEEIRMNASSDGGATFLVSDLLVGGYTAGTHDVDAMDVVLSNGVLAMAWDDNRTGSDEIYVMSSTDLGTTQSEFLVSTTGGGFPRMAGGGDYMGATWSSGVFPNTAEAVYSRDGGLTWPITSFSVSATAGDVDFSEVAYNATYGNFIQVFLDDVLGSNNVYAGGYRAQDVQPVGTLVAGDPISFTISNFPASEAGFAFATAGSLGTGTFLLSDGRETGLLNDINLQKSLINNPGVLSGTIDASGSGSSGSVNLPATAPTGSTAHIIAVGVEVLGPGNGVLHTLTDITTFTIL